MEERLISFETAKLAKEKGLKVFSNTVYQKNGKLHQCIPHDNYNHLSNYNKQLFSDTDGYHDWNSLYNKDIEDVEDQRLHLVSGFNESDEDFFTVECTAIRQHLLQKWLREKYNVEVEVYRTTESDTGEKYGCEGNDWNAKTDEEFDLFNFYDKEFEDVFEKGLYEALKSI